jgi:hypothetical protein
MVLNLRIVADFSTTPPFRRESLSQTEIEQEYNGGEINTFS